MEDREDVREQIYKKICEESILQYKSDTLDIDSMELDVEGSYRINLDNMNKFLYEMLKKFVPVKINQRTTFIRTSWKQR